MGKDKARPLIKRSPLFRGVLPLNKKGVYKDAFAGFTLAIISIPEVMGYTKISGTPIITGIYTLLLPMLIFAIFGASRYLVVAADSATAAILAQALSPLAAVGSPQYMAYVCLLAIMVGMILILCRMLRLGFIANFLSRTVLIGFLTGVGIQVALEQVSGMLGLSSTSGAALPKLFDALGSIPKANLYALAIATIVLMLIQVPKLFATKFPVIKNIPWALMAVIVSIALGYFFNLPAKEVPSVGIVPGGFPHFSIPYISLGHITTLLPTAITIVVVILTQSTATSAAYVNRSNDDFDVNTDLLGLGLANLMAGFSGTFVVNGSPTKTQIVDDAGGRSQLAHISAVVVVAIVLLFLTGPLQFLPESALSALVFVIALHLIDIQGLKRVFKKNRNEFYIALITVAVVVVVGAAQGILFSMLLALIEHLYRSYKPKNSIMVPFSTEDGKYIWSWQPLTSRWEAKSDLLVYHFAASIYYANAGNFSREVRSLIKTRPADILLDFSAIADVDFTGGEVIVELCQKLKSRNIRLALVGVEEHVMSQLLRYGIIGLIGEKNVYPDLRTAILLRQYPPETALPRPDR